MTTFDVSMLLQAGRMCRKRRPGLGPFRELPKHIKLKGMTGRNAEGTVELTSWWCLACFMGLACLFGLEMLVIMDLTITR